MANLILNPTTKQLLDSFRADPAHAVLLVGSIGVGLGTIARDLASQLTEPAYVTTVSPDSGSIPIATIRELYAHTKTKQHHLQVVIIDDADAMKAEAQNALLKLLEEPSSMVTFILTSHLPQLLLQTIHSRLQKIEVRPISAKESAAFLASQGIKDEQKARQILFIAEGHPAEIHRLATDEQYFREHSAVAVDARTFLQSSIYDRLILLSKYNGREDALHFLELLGRFAVHTLYRQPDVTAAKRLDAITTAIERINGNGHVKTQLSLLVMQWG